MDLPIGPSKTLNWCALFLNKYGIPRILYSGTKLDRVAALTFVAATLPICNNSNNSLSDPN